MDEAPAVNNEGEGGEKKVGPFYLYTEQILFCKVCVLCWE